MRRRLERARQLTVRPDASASDIARVLELRVIELEICRLDKVHWFNNWVWTFNPKLVGVPGTTPWMPMDLYPKQEEAIRWFEARSANKEDGHFAKSRDIGFTWMCGGYALNRWLFEKGYKANFGSRKAEYVDRIGDPDSIFEKIRMLYRGLPDWMLPKSMSDNSMLLVNDDRESIIRGEAGDDMGRGGRSTDYFFDEFAFVDHADSVDAASIANSECRIFGSTVNGQGNLFFRKAHDGSMRQDQKFRFHWTDDPRKRDGMITVKSVIDGVEKSETMTWEAATRRKTEKHKFASEYDIDWSASVEGICIEAKWIEACKRIKHLVQLPRPLVGIAGGDVGAGKAKSVLVSRFGPIVRKPTAWSDPDTIDTANRMIMAAESEKFEEGGYTGGVRSLRFDATGVGHGVGAVLKRGGSNIRSAAVLVGNPAGDTKWPDGKTSVEKFANIKACSWWIARERAQKTYQHYLFLTEPNNAEAYEHPLGELLSMPDDSEGPEAMALNSQISLVKWLTTTAGKIIIESKDALAKRGISSPDYADALMLTFVEESTAEKLMKAFAA